MVRHLRPTLLAATLAAALAGVAVPATSSTAETRPTVAVHGRLLVVPSDSPGGHRAYGVALADGEIVRVRGRFAPAARTGAVFTGRLAVPSGVVSRLRARGESGATAALRVAERRSATLRVVGTPDVRSVAPAATPTTHQQFVAALDNEGALGQDDTQLLAHVTSVGGYWTHEANGAIAGITVPATVTHYDTGLTTSDCGLGSDFFSVVQEAAGQFPGFSFNGSDQLVVFVPPACSSGSVVGEGTIGSSFASGGALVVKAGDAIEGTYAHETGHNYGFEHANVRYAGASLEYYGVYDVMGFALPSQYNQLTALSTPYRVFEGITDPGEIQDVDLGDDNAPVDATATIKPRSADSGVRSVRVTDPDTGEHLYLDYRSGTGEDDDAFYAAGASLGYDDGSGHHTFRYAPGVLVTAARSGGGTDILALDASGDTSLQSGDSWSDASGRLTVTVTGLTAGGATVHVDFRPAKQVLISAKPVIHGTPKVGHTLRAGHGHWSPGTSFAYTWYAGGKALPHRTGRSLTLTKVQRGLRIRVRVTGSKPGFTPVSTTSARTGKVT